LRKLRLPEEFPNGDSHAPRLSGSELLCRLAAYVRRYVVLTDEQADLIAIWIIHTYALDAADTTPYLEVVSAEKRSGKTRLLEVLSTVAAKPWFTGRVTAAVLVRKVAHLEPTLLLDESDAAFKGDKDGFDSSEPHNFDTEAYDGYTEGDGSRRTEAPKAAQPGGVVDR